METYLHATGTSVGEFVDRSCHAEALGYSGLLLADTQLNSLDPFQLCVVAAAQTDRLLFGTAVTNMVYRDVTVLACSTVTAAVATRGRFVLGLGTGDGPVYRLGRRPTPIAEFEAGVATLRALVNGGEAAGPLGPIRLGYRGTPAPVLVSAEGPKGLRAAGRVADGVILGSGFDPDVLKWARRHIAAGAKEAGRSADEVGLMAAGMISVRRDREAARAAIRSRIANRAHHNFRFSLETVPEAERPAIERFMAEFDINKPIEDRVPPQFVTDYLIDRFAIAGTDSECVERIDELQRAGIRQILVTPSKVSYGETMETWAQQVMPRVSGAGTPIPAGWIEPGRRR